MAYVRLSAGVYQDQATGQIIRPPGGRLPPGAKMAAGLPSSVVGQGQPPMPPQEQALQAIQPQGPGYSPMVQSTPNRLAAPWNDPSQMAGARDDRPGALMAFGRGKPGYGAIQGNIDPWRIPGTKKYMGQ